MRDSNGGAQKPLYIEAALEQGTSRVAQGVARMQLSQEVALLIERWDVCLLNREGTFEFPKPTNKPTSLGEESVQLYELGFQRT